MLNPLRKSKQHLNRHLSNILYRLRLKFLRKNLAIDVGKQLSDFHLVGLGSIPRPPAEDDVWNRLLMVPWDPTWNMFLMITTFVTTSVYLPLLTAMSIMTEEKQVIIPVFYTEELMYTTDIILYIIARNNPFLSKPTVSSVNRPFWILVIDIISILPLHFAGGTTNLYNKLSLIHCLKFVRIQYELRYIEKMLFYPSCFLSFEIIFWLGCAIAYGTLIAVAIECKLEEECPYDITIVMYNVVHHITNAGYYQVPDETTWTYMKLIIGLPFLIVTVFLLISTRAQHIYRDCYKKRLFTYQYDVTKQILDNISSSPFVTRMYNTCYQTIWRMCDGYSGYLADTLLPYSPNLYKKLVTPVMWMDVMEDLTANFFYHSILFTNIDRSFLRALSAEIKCLVYSKGQLLYIKDELADKMVYIVSGVVQILSSDDEETSVLDMVSGTCLGEATLIFPKVAVSTIRCAKDCEIQVLMSSSYFRICRKYSTQHKVLHNTILGRIKDGRAFKEKADIARQDQNYYMLDMMWMNHMLHKLAGAANRTQARRHQLQNIHLRSFYTEDQLTKIPRMIKYLRLINIAARTLKMENLVFLKTTWPYIIHPDGIMREIMEIIVIVLSLCAAIGIPYMCFMWKSNTGPELVQFLITCLWMGDLFVQVHTAVITEQGIIVDPKKILRYRLTTLDFLIDIFSCLPTEAATVFFTSIEHYSKFQINRAAKLWRVHRMFQRLESNFHLSITVVRVIEILCFLLYAIYVSACVMHSVPCESCDNSYFHGLLSVAVQLCTGISLETSSLTEYAAFYFPMMIFAWFVINAYIAHMIVWFKIRCVFIYKTKQRVQNFQVQIPEHRKDILKNLKRYVETQDQHGQNVTIIYKQQFLDNLTRQQMRIISEVHIGPTLRNCPLFADLGDDNILEICSLTQWRIKPAGDVILNCGDVSPYFMILLEGICEVVNGQTGKHRGFRSACVLNIEVLLDEPICQTVVTVTSCRVIIIEVKKLKRIFELFPQGQTLKPTLDACKDIKEKMHQLPRFHVPLSKFKFFSKRREKTSFYNINENKKTRLFYMRHFLKLKFFSFIRFLLLTITIRPNGKFILCWEVFRSLCVALSALTYINIHFVCAPTSNLVVGMLWCLDLVNYVDIYLRLHVGYYNKQGILIQHPLFTAWNYIHGPFAIDFITCIPFRYVHFLKSKPTSLMLCHMIKALQLYRYFMLSYVKLKSAKAKILLFVIPTCALTLNFIANCAIMVMCDLDDCKKWPRKLDCIEFSMLSQDLVDNGKLYLYSMYIVTGIMTTTGLQGVHYLNQYVFFWFLNVVSLLFYAVFTGFIVSIYYSYDRNFLKYQKLISTLRNFMNREEIPMGLQSIVLDYYQQCWDMRKGQNINFVMQPFSISLQIDVLYEVFGKKILSNWVLQSDDVVLFNKRLLLNMSQLLILPGHDVLELNDVTPYIYILVSGSVIVKDEENTIIRKLRVGSMFGNLSSAKELRMNTLYTAFDIVEMLYVPTRKFLECLKLFPLCYEEFQQYKTEETGLSYVGALNSDRSGTLQKFTDATSRVIRHLLVKILFIAMYVCILGATFNIMIYFYQISVRFRRSNYLIIMYGCDVLYGTLYILLYFLEKYALFKVKYGCLEKQHKFVTILFVCSLVPFEMSALPHQESSHYFYIYISLKSLRFFRLLHIYYIHNSYLLQFSHHMTILRTLAIVIMYILMILFCTAVLSLSGQLYQPNLYLYIDPDLLDALVGYQKFSFFIRLVGYVSNSVLRVTNVEHQPISFLHTILMTIIMVGIRLAIIIGTAELSWIVYDMNLPRLVYTNKITNLLSFMQRWGCSEQVMETVKNYLEINWYTTKGEGIPVLFKYAPRFLKRLLTTHCYLDYVVNHAVFGKCSKDFQRQLVLKFKLEVHENEQIILLSDTHNATMYWVHRGHVLQILKNDENILSKGDCFAYQEGSRELNNSKYQASYKALTQVQIMSLRRKDWIHLLDHFPEAKEIVMDSHFGPTADIIQKLYY